MHGGAVRFDRTRAMGWLSHAIHGACAGPRKRLRTWHSRKICEHIAPPGSELTTACSGFSGSDPGSAHHACLVLPRVWASLTRKIRNPVLYRARTVGSECTSKGQ